MNPSLSPSFYPSKLLLFGEHTVIQGSQALAVPMWEMGGTWEYGDNKKLQYDLLKFNQYLQNLVEKGEIALDTEGVARELERGMFFKSNIPNGYGAGSSGALVAAIYTIFGTDRTMRSRLNNQELINLKTIFGKMESYFHGNSSGFDPLICYIKKPILIKEDQSIEILDDVKNDVNVFLIDSKIARKAETIIKLFIEKNKTPQYNDLVINDLRPNVDDAIAAFIQNQPDILFDAVHKISHFQHRFFSEAIPLSFQNLWLEGLSGDDFKLKLCGAGGGGFILGFCRDVEKTNAILNKSGYKMIPLSI